MSKTMPRPPIHPARAALMAALMLALVALIVLRADDARSSDHSISQQGKSVNRVHVSG